MRIAFAASALCVALASSTAHAQQYAFVVDVAKSGVTFSNPIEALESISDASAEKPYLVRIHPGVYDLETAPILGKPFVDIEGAGQGVTVLKGTYPNWPLLKAAPNATVRDLTVRGVVHLPGDAACTAIQRDCATLRHVTIDAPESSWGVVLYSGGVLDHVSVPAHHGPAVTISGSHAQVTLDHCSLGYVGNISNGGSVGVDGSYNEIMIKDTTTYAPVMALATGSTATFNTFKISHSEIISSRFLYYPVPGGANNKLVFFDSMVLGSGLPVGTKCLGVYDYSALTPVTCP